MICFYNILQVAKVTMTDTDNGGECTYRVQRCVHFYACICAFASDEELSKEFKYAIDADSEPGTTSRRACVYCCVPFDVFQI